MEPVCRRLSSHVCVHFGLPPAKRKDRDYVLASFNKFILCMILTGAARVEPLCRCSLVTFASILVRLQAKQEVGDYVLASFEKIMLCMILAGCAGGTGLPAAL